MQDESSLNPEQKKKKNKTKHTGTITEICLAKRKGGIIRGIEKHLMQRERTLSRFER